MQFFTVADLKALSDAGRVPYVQQDPAVQRLLQRVKNGARAKVRHWADSLALPGWVVKHDPGYFLLQNRQQVFKPYVWARIFRKGDEDKRVFFTIGADADDVVLDYKLDCQHSHQDKKKRLDERQVEAFDQLVRTRKELWQRIPAKDLPKWDWNRLLATTRKFINDYSGVYDEAIRTVGSIPEPRMARICWNMNGWVAPSGPEGKSRHADSHEYRHGFGFEEWLFDPKHRMDGYQVGFLQPVNDPDGAYQGKRFDIRLFTRDARNKVRYLVGRISDVEALTDAQAEQVKKQALRAGWIDAMEKELALQHLPTYPFRTKEGITMFNVRFKPDHVDLLPTLASEETAGLSIPTDRYTFVKEESDIAGVQKPTAGDFTFGDGSLDIEDERNVVFEREAAQVESKQLHRTISNALIKHLRTIHKSSNVIRGQKTGERTLVDVAVKHAAGITFYEIKTYPSVRTCVREALGQLLEYAHWPQSARATELVIVTEHPATAALSTYMKQLRELYGLPVYYQQFNLMSQCLGVRV